MITRFLLPGLPTKGGGNNNTPIGSKERPDAVGDIVFSDGTAVAYSEDLVLTGEQVDAAVAVIFYVGGTDGLGSRILGVGLTTDNNSYRWAVSGADTTNAIANTDAYDGSVNWGRFYDVYADARTTPSNYPAFQYANSYSAPGFTSNWYLPAINELEELKTNVEVVNNAINKIKATRSAVSIISTSGEYWSSSLGNSVGFVQFLDFSSSSSSQGQKNQTKKVRPIHAF